MQNKTTECPQCAEKIDAGSSKCRHCNAMIKPVTNDNPAIKWFKDLHHKWYNNDAKYYGHSGEFDVKILYGIPIVLLGGIIASLIYAYLVVYIPLVGITNILFTCGYTGLMGIAVFGIVKKFKVRNLPVALGFGALTGIIAVYLSWVGFLLVYFEHFTNFNPSYLGMFFSPLEMLRAIANLASRGWVSIFHLTIKGFFLWIFWIIEAIIIAGGCIGAAWFAMHDLVFCEKCEEWSEDNSKILEFNHPDLNELKTLFEQEDLSFLNKITPIEKNEAKEKNDIEFFVIDSTVCQTCKNFFTLSLTQVVKTWDKDEDKEEENETELIHHLLIKKSTLDTIKQFSFK